MLEPEVNKGEITDEPVWTSMSLSRSNDEFSDQELDLAICRGGAAKRVLWEHILCDLGSVLSMDYILPTECELRIGSDISNILH